MYNFHGVLSINHPARSEACAKTAGSSCFSFKGILFINISNLPFPEGSTKGEGIEYNQHPHPALSHKGRGIRRIYNSS